MATVSLVLLSCGTPVAEPSDRSASSATSSSDATRPTPQPTVVMTPTVANPDEEPTWTLVAMGDSVANLSGWPTQLAGLVGSDAEVEVVVDGFSCFGGCSTLTRIEGSTRLQEAIGTARVIVVQPQPGRVIAPVWRDYFAGACGGTDGLECSRIALDEFEMYVATLFDTVGDLAGPETVVLAITTSTWGVDAFYPGLRDTDPATFEDLLGMLIELGRLTQTAAEARCIGVVDVNALFTGPDYHQLIDPAYTNDGRHPSEEGSRVIAEALHARLGEATAGDCE